MNKCHFSCKQHILLHLLKKCFFMAKAYTQNNVIKQRQITLHNFNFIVHFCELRSHRSKKSAEMCQELNQVCWRRTKVFSFSFLKTRVIFENSGTRKVWIKKRRKNVMITATAIMRNNIIYNGNCEVVCNANENNGVLMMVMMVMKM